MPESLVSIVMAAAKAGDSLPESLGAIQSQDFTGSVEVIVAAADEETAEVARRHDVVVVENTAGTTPAGLNIAVRSSSGEYVVRVDAHSRIPPSYVTDLVTVLSDGTADVAGGMQIPVGTSFAQRAIAGAMSSFMGAGDARYRVGGRAGPVDTVYLGAYTRKTFDRFDGYNEAFIRNQDYEFCFRVRQAGGTIWFDPKLKVEYTPRAGLRALAGQYFQYGRWKRFFARTYPGTLQPRQIAAPLLVIAVTSATVASLIWPQLWLVPGIYLASLLVAGLLAVPRVGLAAILTPVALAVMHWAWGFGFLLGQTRDE